MVLSPHDTAKCSHDLLLYSGSFKRYGHIQYAQKFLFLGVSELKIVRKTFESIAVDSEILFSTTFGVYVSQYAGLIIISGMHSLVSKAAIVVNRGYNYNVLVYTSDGFLGIESTDTVLSLNYSVSKGGLSLKRNIAAVRPPWDDSIEILYIHI